MTGITRREALAIAGAAGAGVLAGCGRVRHAAAPATARATLPGAPARQHAWNGRLAVDDAGNVLAPRHQALLVCALAADPTRERAAAADAALTRLERAAQDAGHPLLVAVGWGPAWFARIGLTSPVPAARALSDTEAPALEDPIAVVHLGSDDPRTLTAAVDALAGPGPFASLLRATERRVGFVGPGLPRAHQADTTGLPQDRPLDREAPLFMGFQSGLRRNQAGEADVTITDGPWRGGTTMHVSRVALTLNSWYHGLGDADRVRRMFRADATPGEVARHPGGLANPVRDLARVARRHDVVGHAESMAAARRGNRPVILRRDFNGVEDGAAVVHFVSVQRSIADFERTRRAMNAARAVGASPSVGQQVNNGINEWLTVTSRANLLVPPRAARICPGLAGAQA